MVEKLQFANKHRFAHVGEALDKVLKQRPQSPHDLHAVAAVLPDLCDRQTNKVFPIRRAINQPQFTFLVKGTALCQISLSNFAQKVMYLIDRQDCGCWVVDRWGKSL